MTEHEKITHPSLILFKVTGGFKLDWNPLFITAISERKALIKFIEISKPKYITNISIHEICSMSDIITSNKSNT